MDSDSKGFRLRAEEAPAVLLVSGSHGFPPTQARFARGLEIARGLTRRGIDVDWVSLVEHELEFHEEEDLVSLRDVVRTLHVLDHPRLTSAFWRLRSRFRQALGLTSKLGGRDHAPGAILAHVASCCTSRRYSAVIVCGEHLAPALHAVPRGPQRILDLPRIGSEARRAHLRNGRGEELEAFADEAREMDLLSWADTALVGSSDDTLTLRLRGFRGNLALLPPTGALLPREPSLARNGAPRSPNLLAVGSPTAANLDGVRWFRKHVLPRVVQAVPACRLRVVGELARQIEPAPGVDRVGRVDDLETEYLEARAVVLPLRMGSGVRRRAVEALVRGKPLATTSVGASGTGLVPERDPLVTDDPARMAAGLACLLTSGEAESAIAARALELASDILDPERHFDALVALLGLEWAAALREEPVAVGGGSAPADR